MDTLRNLYTGETVWIVGKGPSLQYLRAEHIAPGPVIAINHAILQVEDINIPNPVFSMQKDGGNRKRYPSEPFDAFHPVWHGCDYMLNCGDRCGDMTRPKRGATLLVHEHESAGCFADYLPRLIFSWNELGLPSNLCSLVIAVKIGQLMGCSKFRFVSCDVQVDGSVESYTPGVGMESRPGYIAQVSELKPYLEGLNCEWITPAAHDRTDRRESIYEG
jgi:hypothetical protein